jgi:NitT/TauT family transport system ATP-binding protein
MKNPARLRITRLSFGYGEKLLFDHLNLDLGFEDSEKPLDEFPIVILGPSGCGKTTLLKLLAELLPPGEGSVTAEGAGGETEGDMSFAKAFVFQEPRLLPWLTAIENITLPLKNKFADPEAENRARRFLRLVSLEAKENSLPEKLSGGEKQRVSIARAFAYPSQILFLDEPFQSLDIPLRIELMDLTLSLLKEDHRLVVMVTHDPREALYLGSRIIVLGAPPQGVVFDEKVKLGREDRDYGSAALIEMEKKLIQLLGVK